VARLDVEIDHTRVACGSVAALAQILEEDPDEHGTDCYANQCQTIWSIWPAYEADGYIL